jgi:hypothetical protein
VSDLNKTKLTEETTDAAMKWLATNGFEPIQKEVTVKDGWIADIAGVIRPTQTEILALKLMHRCPRWNSINHLAQSEWRASIDSMKRQPYTMLTEVKTSRSDFRKDHKWDLVMPTNLAYLAVPEGLISEEEWPTNWGILEYQHDGTVICRRNACLTPVSTEAQRDVIFEISQRLLHTTDAFYLSQRVTQKDDREYEKAKRLREVIQGVCRIVESKEKDFDLALSFSRLPVTQLSEIDRQRLKNLHGIGKSIYDQPGAVSPDSAQCAWLLDIPIEYHK